MADISLRERLQPALLDRLHDQERVVHIVELSLERSRLAQLGVSVAQLTELMKAQGLRALEADAELPASAPTLRLSFSAPSGEVPLSRLKSSTVTMQSGKALTLAECAAIEVRTVRNSALEPAERRSISMRRLRESVLRDLSWLLNTINLESHDDLSAYPEVQRSVLNFGITSLAGRAATSIDPLLSARRIADAIRTFEPRLTRVAVTPELAANRMDQRTLSFKIEAELWGRPTPQRLTLRTRLDVDSGDLAVSDMQGG